MTLKAVTWKNVLLICIIALLTTGCDALLDPPTDVTGITITQNDQTIVVGDTLQLTATVAPTDADDKTVSWSSSATAVATVSDAGLVSAVAAGTATITVTTTDQGKTDSIVVTVNAASVSVTGVTITQDDQTIVVGDTLQLTATVAPTDADDKSVSWSSSDTTVATVNDAGLVSAVAAGTATITVTTTDQGKTDSLVVTVNAPAVPVTGVTITQNDQTITLGDTLQLTATVAPSEADVKTVSWSSSDTTVATVSDTGLVSAVAAGTATITVTTTDQGKTDSIVVTVNAASVSVTGVTITQDDQTMIIGDTLQLTATIAPSDADDKSVSWNSSDAAVATVSDTGLVSAVAAGTATITATTTDQGKTDTIDITVSGGFVTLTLTNKANASDVKSYTLTSGPDADDAVFSSMATFLRDEEATHVIIAMGDPSTAGSMILASSEPMGTDGMGGFFPTDTTYPFTSFYLFAPNAVDATSAVGAEIDLWMFELLSMSSDSTTTEYMSLSGSDTVTIEFDAFGALNEYVRGTFSGTCTDSVPETPVAYDVSGSFVALRAEVSSD